MYASAVSFLPRAIRRDGVWSLRRALAVLLLGSAAGWSVLAGAAYAILG
jgi:hypothetical protein